MVNLNVLIVSPENQKFVLVSIIKIVTYVLLVINVYYDVSTCIRRILVYRVLADAQSKTQILCYGILIKNNNTYKTYVNAYNN